MTPSSVIGPNSKIVLGHSIIERGLLLPRQLKLSIRFIAFLLFSLCSQFCELHAQENNKISNAKREVGSASLLRQQILQLGHKMGLKNSNMSFCFQTASGEWVEHRAGKLNTPASVQKLVTAAAAIAHNGFASKLTTQLYYSGSIEADRLNGDLVVLGGGDPCFSSRYHQGDTLQELHTWAQLLRDLGIRSIQGKLVGLTAAYSGPAFHPDWPENEHWKWYSAGSEALNINDNCLDVQISVVKASKSAAPRVEVQILPPLKSIALNNKIVLTTKKSKHVYSVVRKANKESISVSGRFWSKARKQTAYVSLAKPAHSFIESFAYCLSKAKITVPSQHLVNQSVDSYPARLMLLHEVNRPVIELMLPMLKHSQNLYADCLLKNIASWSKKPGSFEAGAQQCLVNLRMLGINTEGMVIRDGSGLSRKNLCSPKQIASLLSCLGGRADFPLFKSCLAVGGTSGTLKKRQRGELKAKVFAKTGHLRGVSTLAGYLLSSPGRLQPFVFFAHGKFSRSKTDAWQDSALRLIHANSNKN